jgi:hypothetical protein
MTNIKAVRGSPCALIHAYIPRGSQICVRLKALR